MTRAAHRAQQQLGQSLLLEICKASLPVLLLPGLFALRKSVKKQLIAAKKQIAAPSKR